VERIEPGGRRRWRAIADGGDGGGG